MSPFHLVFPILEVEAEVRLADHLGMALVGGVGSLTDAVKDPAGRVVRENTVRVQEFGGQLLWYPLQPFESLTVGAEFLYIHVSGDAAGTTVSGVAGGGAIGPLLGYKLITKGGFTLFVQGGAEYLFGKANATDNADGTTATAAVSEWIPLLNFNIGWSF